MKDYTKLKYPAVPLAFPKRSVWEKKLNVKVGSLYKLHRPDGTELGKYDWDYSLSGEVIFSPPSEFDHQKKCVYYGTTDYENDINMIFANVLDTERYGGLWNEVFDQMLLCVGIHWGYDEIIHGTSKQQPTESFLWTDKKNILDPGEKFRMQSYCGPTVLWLFPDKILRTDNVPVEFKNLLFKQIA